MKAVELMGAIRLYKCGCGYEERLFVGSGLGSVMLTVIEKSVPEDIFSEFKNEKEKHSVTGYLLRNSVISCPECRKLGIAADFTYSVESGRNVRYIAPCSGCGRKCVPTDNAERISCPVCGRNMTFEDVGHWD